MERWLWSFFNFVSCLIGLSYGSYPPATWPEALLWIFAMLSLTVMFAMFNGAPQSTDGGRCSHVASQHLPSDSALSAAVWCSRAAARLAGPPAQRRSPPFPPAYPPIQLQASS